MVELLSKLLDLALGGLLQKRRERKALIREFDALKRRILYVGLINELPVELHKLREFFLEKGLVDVPGFSEFFSNWLMDPLVVTGRSVANPMSREAIVKLQGELDALQI